MTAVLLTFPGFYVNMPSELILLSLVDISSI